jgi:hypothetical protein
MSARILEGAGILGGYAFDAAEPQYPSSQSPLDFTNETSADQKLLAELERVNADYRNSTSSDARGNGVLPALNALLDHLPEIVPGIKLTAIQDLLWQLNDLGIDIGSTATLNRCRQHDRAIKKIARQQSHWTGRI